MKTPYDAAMRLRQREIDAVSERIALTSGDLARIEGAEREIAVELCEEARVADSEYRFAAATCAYFARQRRERAVLGDQARAANRELDSLREQAADALGALRAIEGAASTFRTEAEREIARAEQGEVDDRAAIDFILARRKWLKSQIQ